MKLKLFLFFIFALSWPTLSLAGYQAYLTGIDDFGVPGIVKIYNIGSDGKIVKLPNTIPIQNRPRGLTLSADSKYLFVANNSVNSISIIDTQTQQVVSTVQKVGPGTFGPTQMTISPDGKTLFTSTYDGKTVVMIDITNILQPKILNNIIIGNINNNRPGDSSKRPYGLTVSPNGKFVYAANLADQSISIIDLNQLAQYSDTKIPPTFTVGKGPWDVKITPDGKKLLVTNSYEASIGTCDVDPNTGVLSNYKAYNEPPDALSPQAMTLSPNGQFAYVVNLSSTHLGPTGDSFGILAVIDLTKIDTPNAFAEIRIGYMPQELFLTADLKTVFILNRGGPQTRTDRLGNTIRYVLPSSLSMIDIPTKVETRTSIDIVKIPDDYPLGFALVPQADIPNPNPNPMPPGPGDNGGDSNNPASGDSGQNKGSNNFLEGHGCTMTHQIQKVFPFASFPFFAVILLFISRKKMGAARIKNER